MLLVPLVRVELHSLGLGVSISLLVALSVELHSKVVDPSPSIYGIGGGCAPTSSTC